jgi:LPXTG-motif cell wall-anchored protein
MNETIMQAAIWIAAGLLLIMLMGRRRKRKVQR